MPVDSPYLVRPGHRVNLSKLATDDKGPFKHRSDGEKATAKNLEKLASLQELLYADASRALLIVIQAMDTGGKDGLIKHVFEGVNPEGCQVTSFKTPSTLERGHDFLWRVHAAVPRKGWIGIFNRSQYEDVLVVRVHDMVPKDVWSQRYEAINAFERLLDNEGTTVLKFFLHISKDEQKKRLQARLDDPDKHWKFEANDLAERKLWDEYQVAYEDAVNRCSTAEAPWYVIPADHKWFRNWAVSDIIVRTLQRMKMSYPTAASGLGDLVIE